MKTYAVLFLLLLAGCRQSGHRPLVASYALGKLQVVPVARPAGNKLLLTLRTRFGIDRKKLASADPMYFQYRLGDKLRLVLDGDTLRPQLSYAVPLLDETVKEVDARFEIDAAQARSAKTFIVADSLYQLQTVAVPFK